MTYIKKEAGVLKRALYAHIKSSGTLYSRDAMTVMQNDPYRLDTPANHRDGEWLAEQLERAIGPYRKIHWRGLQYAIVAQGNVRKPNGEIYRNTEEDWVWLSAQAGKAARWLGYIPFERIIDARNAEPILYRPEKKSTETWITAGLDVSIPDADDLEPKAQANFRAPQPYSFVMWGEKTSLKEVLEPIAKRYGADLYLTDGEPSDTVIHDMAARGAAYGRPMVVFTHSDCDPGGHQMPISIGRKIQALRDLKFNDLEFDLVPVALTLEQVKELGLPSTPLKETEKRADKWRGAYGIEQTEIDALATLRRQVLREIVENAIDPFYDHSLEERLREAEEAWEEEAQAAIDEQIDPDDLHSLRMEAEVKLEELREAIEDLNERMRFSADGRFRLPEVEVPEPEADEDEIDRQAYLISKDWHWVNQTRSLIARKKYEDGGAP
jgi:hypothetical protein